MKQKLVDRVAFRLVLWLVSFSIILTILGTAGQLYFDYTDELKQVGGSVETAVLQQLPDVYRSVLAGDSSSVDNILFNLVKNSGLAYAAVIVDKRSPGSRERSLPAAILDPAFP